MSSFLLKKEERKTFEEEKMFERGKKKMFDVNRKSVEKDRLIADIRIAFANKTSIVPS